MANEEQTELEASFESSDLETLSAQVKGVLNIQDRRYGFPPEKRDSGGDLENEALIGPRRRFLDAPQPSAPPFWLTYGEPLVTCPLANRHFPMRRCVPRPDGDTLRGAPREREDK